MTLQISINLLIFQLSLPPEIEFRTENKFFAMTNFKRTLITTALPYANGPIHIGHLAGVYVPADIYARYLRLKNEDIVLIGGSDEHGVPITLKAKNEGITPQDVVDKFHKIIKESFSEIRDFV
jgi:methionyl-tRNA synthetase